MAERQKFKFRINGPEEENKELEKEQPAQGQVAERVKRVEERKDKLPFEIKYIPRKKIKENKKNHYPKEKMESLQESILQFGLQQNLSVIYLMEDDSFVLEAGHRRTQALDNLIQEFANYENKEDPRYQLYLKNVHEYSQKGYPCRVTAILSENIQYDYEDEENLEQVPDEVIESEIRLIVTNEEIRDMDPNMQALNIARLSKLYERWNMGKPCIQRINIDKQIAKDLKLSTRQVKNYRTIDKLIPELREAFLDNHITLSDSMNFSKLTEEEQAIILELLQKGHKVSKDEIDILKKENATLEKEIQEKTRLIEDIKESAHEDKTETAKQEIARLKEEIKVLENQKAETFTMEKDQIRLTKLEWKVTTSCSNLRKDISLLEKALAELNKERKNSNSAEITIREALEKNGILPLFYSYIND